MSDASKYLPLSRRPRHDESAVTGDWSTPLRTTLESLADLLDALPAAAWERVTLRDGVTVRDAAGDLVWRLETTRAARARAVVGRRMARRSVAASPVFAAGGDTSDAGVTSRLRAVAAHVAGPTRMPELTAAVVAALDIAASTGAPLELDPNALGAVAVARALSAPLPIRAVVGARTFQAMDATWQVGRGPALRSTGGDIVLFLFGRTGLPAETAASVAVPTVAVPTKDAPTVDSATVVASSDVSAPRGVVVGGPFGGTGVDSAQLEPLWAQIQPFLKGLGTDEIVDKVSAWARDLELPLLGSIPADVVTRIQQGVAVPLQKLLAD